MIRSRIVFVFLVVCGLLALGSVSTRRADASRAGWISDESCGTQHISPAARIACRNAGVEVLRWGTRNGNPNAPYL